LHDREVNTSSESLPPPGYSRVLAALRNRTALRGTMVIAVAALGAFVFAAKAEALGTNIVANPSFERLCCWLDGDPAGPDSISRVPSGYNGIAAHAGSYFERVRTEWHTVGAVDTGIVSKAFPITDVQYRYSAWIHAPVGATIGVGIDFIASEGGVQERDVHFIPGTGAWQHVAYNVGPPLNPATAQVWAYQRKTTAPITFYTDLFTLKPL
jgi:hypothetical protein